MKIVIPEKRIQLDSMDFIVRWGEMDALGHVNNVVYFRYMETARAAWLSKINIKLGENNESFVIANTFCNYLKPITFPSTITVDTFVANVGNSSAEFVHEFTEKSSPEKPLAIGLCTGVWVNIKSGKSLSLPIKITKFFEQ